MTLDLSSHLDTGYSHMRDDDPQSLNDDFIRTFTVSSLPSDPANPARGLKDDEFEITIRKVGVATGLLFNQRVDSRVPFEVGVKGFGGEFEVRQQGKGDAICFVAAGVGITPILPALYGMDFGRLRLVWSVREADVGLVVDVLDKHEGLGSVTEVFITGVQDVHNDSVRKVEEKGAKVYGRRLAKEDFERGLRVERYYLCTALALRRQLSEWLTGKELIFEDFNF